MSEPKVMVGIPTAGYSRNDSFYDYYNMLQRPAGTHCAFARGQSPARNRNTIIRQALKLNCTHILFLDDDMTFPPDTLYRLLAHDKDIVTGLYLMRNFPNSPVIFDVSFNDGRCRHIWPADGQTGLIEIVNCGLGCCLIKTDVFRAMPDPWILLGETEPDHWGDDIGFFNRVRAKGFKLHCDLTLLCGHLATVKIQPVYHEGKWIVSYGTGGVGEARFPMIRPSPELIDRATDEANEKDKLELQGATV